MKIDLRTTGEIVAVISVIATLAFVGLELRMNRQVATTEFNSSAADTTIEISSLLASHPSVWRRGCIGEELSEDEELVFGSLVQAVDRHFFYRYRRVRDGITAGNEIAWAYRVAWNRVLWPGFDRKWVELKEAGGGIGGGFDEVVETQYDRLKNELSPGSIDSSLCNF